MLFLRIPAVDLSQLMFPGGASRVRLLHRNYSCPISIITVLNFTRYTIIFANLFRISVGYVAQEPILFPGTIKENIALGKPQYSSNPPTDKEIIAAAEMACADEFIKNLPNGYDTVVGSTTQLSGGQMQRICIARWEIKSPLYLIQLSAFQHFLLRLRFVFHCAFYRALLRDPKILVLDEATSALDQLSEQHVQEALKNIRKKKRITTGEHLTRPEFTVVKSGPLARQHSLN